MGRLVKLKNPEGIYIDPDDRSFNLVGGRELPLPSAIGETLRARLNAGAIVYCDAPEDPDSEPEPEPVEDKPKPAPKGKRTK